MTGRAEASLSDIIAPGSVVASLRAASKAQVMAELARVAAAQTRLDADAILAALNAREALGSTGIGKGIALPHARVAGLERISGVFARLARPIDFEAIDGKPVDLIFLLLAPEAANSEHIKVLSRVSRVLRDDATRQGLRAAGDAGAVYALLTAAPK